MSSPSRPGWPLFTDRLARALHWLAGAAIACTTVAKACGPDFPNRYFDLSADEILAAPEGYFAQEIARLAAERHLAHRVVELRAGETLDSTFVAESAEVVAALRETGTPAREARRIADAYLQARRELEKRRDSGAPLEAITAPAGLPEEFRLYFAGAVAWHRGAITDATPAWQAVLALPETQRKHRGLWAAYMLGRAAQLAAEEAGETPAGQGHAAEAAKQFHLVRTLAAAGQSDPRGLAAESYGWEANAAWRTGNRVAAFDLYLDQYAAGDSGALVSLRWLAGSVFDEIIDERVVADATSRRVLTAFLVSRIGSSPWANEDLPFGKWAEDLATACERAGVAQAPEADRLAWLAYEGGLFELAAHWVKLAPDDSIEANWIRAKLALRGGDLAAGENFLRAASRQTSADDDRRPRLFAELGRVALARNDYPAALTAWLEGEHWQDAAFIAEHVMTTGELREFVDRLPVPKRTSAGNHDGWSVEQPAALRLLLARRLARANQCALAEPYFAPAERAQVREFATAMQLGFDTSKKAAARSAAFWRAAQIAREHGMELFGTELEPDWSIWGGEFDLGSTTRDRKGEHAPERSPFAPTADELARLERVKLPEKRFHYRYRAAEIAGWAAGLLPNDSPEAAHILYTAGGWLKARDPEAANPFYQALVIRCGNTPLGRAAAAKRWFPDNEDAAVATFAEPEKPVPSRLAPRPQNPRHGRR